MKPPTAKQLLVRVRSLVEDLELFIAAEERKPLLHPEVNGLAEFSAEMVARQYGFTLAQLRSRDRHEPICEARHVAMFVTKELTGMALHKLAEFFNRTDHGTVSHGIKRVEFWMEGRDKRKENIKLLMSSIVASIEAERKKVKPL